MQTGSDEPTAPNSRHTNVTTAGQKGPIKDSELFCWSRLKYMYKQNEFWAWLEHGDKVFPCLLDV